jgi:TRAP-type C4-dicarboxylate transport system substrate-binding protein
MRLPANDLPPIRLTTPSALRQGGIGMAVPGTWVLTGFVPDCDIVQLPVFYGQSIDAVHRVIDGPVGQTINKELEEKLDAKVLGNWLDLGLPERLPDLEAADRADRRRRR